uniref:Uncharacterized protein n=1 Tax=Rhizophora mucronata TaxID=61149 RepID=A0A2P2NU15_RHIMU
MPLEKHLLFAVTCFIALQLQLLSELWIYICNLASDNEHSWPKL